MPQASDTRGHYSRECLLWVYGARFAACSAGWRFHSEAVGQKSVEGVLHAYTIALPAADSLTKANSHVF